MLTIKPVGSMKSFFAEDEYMIDVKNCIDVVLYIQSMHPKLGLFMKQAQALATFEDFCFLDKEGNIINPQLFPFYKFEDDDLIYIAPVIVGAGGKAGTIVAIAVLIVVAIYAPQIVAALGPQVGMGGVAAEASLAASMSFISAGVAQTITSIAVSMALNLVMQLFTSTPKARTREITKDSTKLKLTEKEKNQYHEENSIAAEMVLVDRKIMPKTHQELKDWVIQKSREKDYLVLTDVAKDVADIISGGPVPRHIKPIWPFIAFTAFNTLPPEFKNIYGIKETKFKTTLLNFNLYFLKYSRPFLPPFFRLIAPARWAKQRLTRNPNLSFKDKSKLL